LYLLIDSTCLVLLPCSFVVFVDDVIAISYFNIGTK
jgi:hypothetical protein